METPTQYDISDLTREDLERAYEKECELNDALIETIEELHERIQELEGNL